jgi:hypothetical protein
MLLCGVAACAVGLVYLVISILAMADGPSRLEIPRELNTLCAAAVVLPAIVSVAAWIVDRSGRDRAEHTMRPLIRGEVERALEGAVPGLVESIVMELGLKLDPKLREVATHATTRQAAMLREIITGEVMHTMLDAAVGRAHRAGMLHQAQAAVGTAKVRTFRTVTSADD